ncbi:hypothetical protein ABH917_003483 [Thermobifida halotolerans]|uniref:hypothetical protein n=1 Tax=Thermobifida halotolerans TaxID=483545 RepID=UPI0035138B79
MERLVRAGVRRPRLQAGIQVDHRSREFFADHRLDVSQVQDPEMDGLLTTEVLAQLLQLAEHRGVEGGLPHHGDHQNDARSRCHDGPVHLVDEESEAVVELFVLGVGQVPESVVQGTRIVLIE